MRLNIYGWSNKSLIVDNIIVSLKLYYNTLLITSTWYKEDEILQNPFV